MNTKECFIIFIFLLSISSVFSQQDAAMVTQASATVVEPITVTKSVALNFESVAIIIAGSVELTPLNSKSKPADIVLPVSGTFTAASFIFPGETAYTYKITVPKTPMEVTRGNDKMIVRSFDSDPILNPDSELLAGVFVSVSPMNVTVNYN